MHSHYPLENKRVLVTGGTGSLGRTAVRRILTGEMGIPSKIIVFSRDEAKQHYMRLDFSSVHTATDEVVYKNAKEVLDFRVGDIRDRWAIKQAVRNMDVIIHAAALKQVPNCERYPFEAVQTNIVGAQNLIRAVAESDHIVHTVVGVSTDKACKPVNVMGMSKAIMERLFVQANLEIPQTRFVCVRYGNVIASRGSVVPLFVDQIKQGGPITITLKEMTRFLLSLDKAVDTVFAAIRSARRGETYIPQVPAARVVDIAKALMGDKEIPILYTGIRPGEKIHEILVSEEEQYRTVERDGYYVIRPMLTEFLQEDTRPALEGEYSSSDVTLTEEELRGLLASYISEQSWVGVPA